jgi:hypothetical protein
MPCAVAGATGTCAGRGLGVGLVLRGRDGRVAVGRGHGGGRYGCLTLGARLTVEIWGSIPHTCVLFSIKTCSDRAERLR